MSAPACKKLLCILIMLSGCVRVRISLLPLSGILWFFNIFPRKWSSSSVKAWIIVPIAPSKTSKFWPNIFSIFFISRYERFLFELFNFSKKFLFFVRNKIIVNTPKNNTCTGQNPTSKGSSPLRSIDLTVPRLFEYIK